MSLPPGAQLAGFTIERLLGAGGMGTVYLAKHPRMRRRVALKVLADNLAVDPKTRASFDREATLAAGLDHPNIVPVYDRSGIEDPALWLAMRYIDGGDAAGLLRDSPNGLAPARVVRLLTDAAHALDYAHAQGVLHRDVKPANLLIENDQRLGERAVLTDFGIARSFDDTVTLSGIVATFAYAAPERFEDAPSDHRADIYSLGCTLFQLLTGKPPFPRKDQAAVIGAHLSAPPPAPRELRPELPAELDAVIATVLAKSPRDRYPTCTALAEATARALASREVTVRAEPPRPVVVSSNTVPPPAVAAPPSSSTIVAVHGRSSRLRRFAVVSGLLLTGISVAVGAAFAVRGDSTPPDSSPIPSSTTVPQQITTTTPPRTEQPSPAPLPVDAPPPADTFSTAASPPPAVNAPPIVQQQAPTYRPPNPAPQGPVPQTRVHQWPG